MKVALLVKCLALSLLLAATAQGRANEAEFDIDPRTRAKIAKEKVRQGALLRESTSIANKGLDNANCGSQNIGNIDTKGRPGSSPREVFVFAPNAINIVSGSGCR
jgi:hypothetical protein